MLDAISAVPRAYLDDHADEPDEPAPRAAARARRETVTEVYRDEQVRVVSDMSLSSADAARLTARIEKAYAYDSAHLRWDNPEPITHPLTVAVLSTRAFSAFTGDTTGSVAGVTTGPNLFVVPRRVALGDPTPSDENTIAHELTHVQEFREAGSAVNRIPTYLIEGRAYLMGDSYAQNPRLAHQRHVTQTLGAISASQADYVLDRFVSAKDEQRDSRLVYLGEITGALFVEFLRTRLNGSGKSDAIARLSDVTESVAEGQSFDAAFRREFGLGLTAARRQFSQYLEATQGRPRERLRGTLYGAS